MIVMKGTLILYGLDNDKPTNAILIGKGEENMVDVGVSHDIYNDVLKCKNISKYSKLEISPTNEITGLSISIPNKSLYNYFLSVIKQRCIK